MKNILSIDFDIIMAPCIELYNELVPRMSWKTFDNFPQMKLLTIDTIHYKRLTKMLISLFQIMPKENIIWIEDQGQMYKYLKNFKNINLINIDHHHDIQYHIKEKNEKLNCGNWVYHLRHNISNYTWINNSNSHKPEEIEYKKLINNIYNLQDFDFDTMAIPDKIFICLSEPWVPPTYRELYYTWMDIANEIYNTKFKIDFERCE